MPSLVGYRPLRLLCDLGNPNHIVEQRTGIAPSLVRGSPVAIQIALALDRTVCSGVAALVQSLHLEVRESANPAAPALMSGAVLAADLDDTLTPETWAAKTAQHATFAFSAQQTNLAAGEKWITIWFLKANGDPVTCAYGKLKVIEDGAGDPGVPAVDDPDYYTRAEADARYAQRNGGEAAFRVSADGAFLQLKDATTGKWRSVWFAAGVLQFGAEES